MFRKYYLTTWGNFDQGLSNQDLSVVSCQIQRVASKPQICSPLECHQRNTTMKIRRQIIYVCVCVYKYLWLTFSFIVIVTLLLFSINSNYFSHQSSLSTLLGKLKVKDTIFSLCILGTNKARSICTKLSLYFIVKPVTVKDM